MYVMEYSCHTRKEKVIELLAKELRNEIFCLETRFEPVRKQDEKLIINIFQCIC